MKKMMMIAAMMVATLSANAQREVGSLTFKPMVGMTLSTMTNSEASMKVGLAAGVELEYQIAEPFSLTGGVLYSMQGAKIDETILGEKIKATYNFDYLNIPILANFYVTRGLAIKAGIQPSFNLKHKVKAEYAGYSETNTAEGIKTFDFSIPVGISYEFYDFVIDARYQWGLTKIGSGADAKNSVFMISLGYKI